MSLKMTKEETDKYIKEMRECTEKISRYPILARIMLMETGVYDKDGNLMEPYK